MSYKINSTLLALFVFVSGALTGCASKTTTVAPTGQETSATTYTTTSQSTAPNGPTSVQVTRTDLATPAATSTTTSNVQVNVPTATATSAGTTSESTIAAANGPSPATVSFLTEAAQGGQAEIALGRIALEKSSNPDVKQFAQRLVDDHSKASSELQQIAASKGVTLPKEPSADQKAEADEMASLSGADFDRAFIEHAVSDHEKDVQAFQDESKMSDDPDVKAFASKTVPTLQQHLDIARSLQDDMSASR